MAKYVIAYHGGRHPKSLEGRTKHMAKWKSWVGSLGAAAVNPRTSLGKSKIVSSKGVSDYDGKNDWSGFTIVEANNMDEALEIATECPILDIGGTVEVAKVIKAG